MISTQVGDDHWAQAKTHLTVPLAQLNRLFDEGLEGLENVRFAKEDVGRRSLPMCEVLVVNDGAADASSQGTSGPASTYCVPKLPIVSDKLGEYVLKEIHVAQDDLAKLYAAAWPFDVTDNETNRRKFALYYHGIIKEDLIGIHSLIFCRFDIMHPPRVLFRRPPGNRTPRPHAGTAASTPGSTNCSTCTSSPSSSASPTRSARL